jgi:SAM-dependent methyltransferase
MMADRSEVDYVLGTHDEEVARLGLQHRVWRPRVLDAWQRAGFASGQRILDVGAGPGFASFDLAGIVGVGGHVFAVERSRRFLDVLERERDRRGLTQISTTLADLDRDELPTTGADGAWCRWVLAFVKRPEAVVRKVAASLRSGGVFVLHEYLDYAVWQLLPRSAPFEAFVAAVMAAWRADGGEPDVGVDLPRWLEAAGFELRSLRPLVDVITPADPIWPWPEAFVRTGVDRLVALGRLSSEQAAEILEDFDRRKADPHTRCATPLVLEAIAVKR